MKHLFILVIFFIFSGCESFYKQEYIKEKNNIDKKIEEVKEEFNIKIEENEKKTKNNLQETINKIESNSREANVNIFGAMTLNNTKTSKDRVDELIDLKLKTASVLLPPPTPEQLIEENEKIKKELDETKITLAELQSRYKIIVEDNIKKTQDIGFIKKELTILEEEKKFILEEKNKKENNLQEYRNKLNQSQISILQEKEREAKDSKEFRLKLAFGAAGVGTILIILGVAVFKTPILSLIGGGFLAFSLFIGTAPTFVLWGVPLLLVLSTVIYFIFKYKGEKDISDRAIGSIQEIRNSSERIYQKKYKPILQDWFKDKKNLHPKVEKRLVELNLK